MVLSCSAGCSPSCTYQWTKGAQVLSSANGILTLNDVSRQQDGVYSCQATNSAGEGTQKITLEVQCKSHPQRPLPPQQHITQQPRMDRIGNGGLSKDRNIFGVFFFKLMLLIRFFSFNFFVTTIFSGLLPFKFRRNSNRLVFFQ